MKQIILFGAGKSASLLIAYLLELAPAENWHLVLVDANEKIARERIGSSPHGSLLSFDVSDTGERSACIRKADIVISLLPPALHALVAADCLQFRKHLLTASYVDEALKAMEADIESAGLLFLCEMGLDPGIDHMSAKKMIDEIEAQGGTITSFISHCGGLVAPESDDNPWHYKISWNPRNVVIAGKSGALYKQDGTEHFLNYTDLFAQRHFVDIPGHETLCWYPNRDSLRYLDLYGLPACSTFIRTTLRHPDFIYGWKNIIDLKLTDETLFYDTDGKTLKEVFKEHLDRNGFEEWLQVRLYDQFDSTKKALSELMKLVEMEDKLVKEGKQPMNDFMVVDESGNLESIDIDELKLNAATLVANRMHDSKLTLRQLFYLGIDDEETYVNRGRCSAAGILQFALERKLALQPSDKDLIVMLHEVEYERNDQRFLRTATLLVTGENATHTAMARTVGLPLGIAARLILNGTITRRGLHIPITEDIYNPVLRELEDRGIRFSDKTHLLP